MKADLTRDKVPKKTARGGCSAKEDEPGAEGDSNLTNKGLSTRASRASCGAAIITMQVHSNGKGPRVTLRPEP